VINHCTTCGEEFTKLLHCCCGDYAGVDKDSGVVLIDNGFCTKCCRGEEHWLLASSIQLSAKEKENPNG